MAKPVQPVMIWVGGRGGGYTFLPAGTYSVISQLLLFILNHIKDVRICKNKWKSMHEEI